VTLRVLTHLGGARVTIGASIGLVAAGEVRLGLAPAVTPVSRPAAIEQLSVLGKQVDVIIDTVSAVLGQVQSGQIKALAVTGKDRFPAVPNVPAAIESGVLPGYDVTTWYGFFAPRGTPPAVIAKLNKAMNEIIAEPAVRERLTKAGVVVKGSTPEAFGAFMADEYARWNKVREAAGLAQL